MKALSVIMPWPLLIMHCGKDVENRSWKTDFRGRVLIHASKKTNGSPFDILSALRDKGVIDWNSMIYVFSAYPQQAGCIIGSVELVDCVQNHASRWAESGMWHWVLKDPQPFKNPVPAKGALGLWEYRGRGYEIPAV